MGRKKALEKRQARLQKKLDELRAKLSATQDVAEARALASQIEETNEDLQETAEELEALGDDEPAPAGEPDGDDPEPAPAPTTDPQTRSGVQQGVQLRGGNPIASYMQNQNPTQRGGSILDSMEYRSAFANYVRTGDESGFAQFETRADATLITSDVGKIIPNTIMNEFIKEMKVYGNLYNRVRKLNVKGGVEFPIEALVPTISWITETTVSETQKAPEIKTSVSFGYYIAEARISQSLLSQVVTLSVLESEIARLLAEAFVKEFDRIILNGTGSGQPTGILKDSRVASNHKIAFTAAEVADWTKWRTKLFAKVPLAYRGQGVLIMTAATWESQIMTMKDDTGRPLYKETYDPVTGALTCRFNGREVILVESDILKDFDTATSGEAWAIYLKPTDYAINSNLQLGFKRWFDDDKNRYVNKGLVIMDGKLLDVNGVFILTK